VLSAYSAIQLVLGWNGLHCRGTALVRLSSCEKYFGCRAPIKILNPIVLAYSGSRLGAGWFHTKKEKYISKLENGALRFAITHPTVQKSNSNPMVGKGLGLGLYWTQLQTAIVP